MEDIRQEFVSLALKEGVNRRELCRRFGISPATGYKWINRSEEGFSDRSRRPKSSPLRTHGEIEQLVIDLRVEHSAWGGRKLRRRLVDLGHFGVPSASTITEILRRHNVLGARAGVVRDWQRFERETPNELWQMDYKGHFDMGGAGRCHPLTLIDDHSRYSIGIFACTNELRVTVQAHLTDVFRRFGIPDCILCDNGSPWGTSGGGNLARLTKLKVWLMRVGVSMHNGAPYHPETQGKLERFHRSLKAEALQGRPPADLAVWQSRFDAFRRTYNHERPHESLDDAVPASRYKPSLRAFPEVLLEPEYSHEDAVRRVQKGGEVHYKGRVLKLSDALEGQIVGLRPGLEDGVLEVRFFRAIVAQVNLRYNRD